jgi:hypothetical protein
MIGCHRFKIRMVGDDQRDLVGTFRQTLSPKQLLQAVIIFGYHDRNTQFSAGKHDIPVGIKFPANGLKCILQFISGDIKIFHIPHDPQKEGFIVRVYVLVKGDNIPPVLGDESGDRGYQSFLIRTGE